MLPVKPTSGAPQDHPQTFVNYRGGQAFGSGGAAAAR
jgi:hypothetical protein